MRPTPLPRLFPRDRIISLSDAVFGVVITLLVLSIEVPEAAAPDVLDLRSSATLGHQILVYFVSFWVIAMYWAQHSLLFASLTRIDRATSALNLVFLLPVTLLPFVTQLMGSRPESWEVVLVFAVTNLFAVFAFQRMWKHVVSVPDLPKGPETAVLARRISLGLRVFVAATVVAVLVSLINVRAGIVCFVLTPIAHFYNYLRDPLRATSEPGSEEGSPRE